MEPSSAQPIALPPPKNLRKIGWVLVVIGTGLSAGMLYLSIYPSGIYLGYGITESGPTDEPKALRTY